MDTMGAAIPAATAVMDGVADTIARIGSTAPITVAAGPAKAIITVVIIMADTAAMAPAVLADVVSPRTAAAMLRPLARAAVLAAVDKRLETNFHSDEKAVGRIRHAAFFSFVLWKPPNLVWRR